MSRPCLYRGHNGPSPHDGTCQTVLLASGQTCCVSFHCLPVSSAPLIQSLIDSRQLHSIPAVPRGSGGFGSASLRISLTPGARGPWGRGASNYRAGPYTCQGPGPLGSGRGHRGVTPAVTTTYTLWTPVSPASSGSSSVPWSMINGGFSLFGFYHLAAGSRWLSPKSGQFQSRGRTKSRPLYLPIYLLYRLKPIRPSSICHIGLRQGASFGKIDHF